MAQRVGQARSYEPHVHLGPLGVDAHLQGQGVGSLTLAEHSGASTPRRPSATSRPTARHVRLYERFGYVVTAEAPVIGVPNWFMRREPAV